jgi:hypothetical protein
MTIHTNISQKLFFIIMITTVIIVEHLFSSSSENFIDTWYKAFEPIHEILRQESHFLTRVIMFGVQSFVMGLIIMAIFYLILLKDEIVFGYKILSMYILRIICMVSFILPNSPTVVWHLPGLPLTLNDYFFSGHIALVILFSTHIHINYGYTKIAYFLGIFFNLFQVFIFLTTQSHYSCDIITGIFCAFSLNYIFDIYFPQKTGTKLKNN